MEGGISPALPFLQYGNIILQGVEKPLACDVFAFLVGEKGLGFLEVMFRDRKILDRE